MRPQTFAEGRRWTNAWRPTLHGGRSDIQEDLASQENAAKRRRQDLEDMNAVQKATGVAGVTIRSALEERTPRRLVERKATDAGPVERHGAIICPACGQLAARGSISCANCTEAACDRETVAAAREVLAEEPRLATRMVVKWIDRGVRSAAGDLRAQYKQNHDRAKKGIKKENDWVQHYDSVAKRFEEDDSFRHSMAMQGWDEKSICLIDAIPPRRTRDAHVKNAL